MRKRGRTDGNQSEIVEALRDEPGVKVSITSAMGDGFPDLVVGVRGVNLLAEVKDGTLVPSRQRLTADEYEWHSTWTGSAAVVRSVNDALELVRAVPDPWRELSAWLNEEACKESQGDTLEHAGRAQAYARTAHWIRTHLTK